MAEFADVVESASGERARAYSGGTDDARMAVLVQAMAPNEASGVAFGADPISGDRDSVVVEAAAGLGEQVVGGEVVPDRWTVRGDTVDNLAGGQQGHACPTTRCGSSPRWSVRSRPTSKVSHRTSSGATARDVFTSCSRDRSRHSSEGANRHDTDACSGCPALGAGTGESNPRPIHYEDQGLDAVLTSCSLVIAERTAHSHPLSFHPPSDPEAARDRTISTADGQTSALT